MDFSYLSSALIAAEEIDPEGNQSIGWLAGGFTLLLFLIIALLLWSFVRMARRARQPWEGDEDEGPAASDSSDEPTP